jgi:hypothetical protein
MEGVDSIKLKVREVKLGDFEIYKGIFKSCGNSRVFCEVFPKIYNILKTLMVDQAVKR